MNPAKKVAWFISKQIYLFDEEYNSAKYDSEHASADSIYQLPYQSTKRASQLWVRSL
jgi:hypothetical protein